jgi:hypothetical protein
MNPVTVIIFVIVSTCGVIWTRGFFRYLVPWEDKPSRFALIAVRLIFIVFVIQGAVYLIKR